MLTSQCRPHQLARRAAAALAVVATVTSGAVATASAATYAGAPVTAAQTFVLPAATNCLKHGQLTIALRHPRHMRWISATIRINGRPFRTLSGRRLDRPVTLRGLPSPGFKVTIAAKASTGRTVSLTRSYTRCAPTSTTPTKPTKPTTPPTKAPAPPTIRIGSYSGPPTYFYASNNLSFYVSSDGAELQNVVVPNVALGCMPSGNLNSQQIAIASVPVAADGSFSSTTTQTGVVANTPAKFTYTFNGQFHATNVTGVFREDVSYGGATLYSCTSNSQAWTATFDKQDSQTWKTPAAGTYSGAPTYFYASNNLSFYVSSDGAELQNVVVPNVALGCTPSGNLNGQQIAIASIPVAADGSFSSTTTQTGVVGNTPAKFTYTFNGQLHGPNSDGLQRVAGIFREDITYGSGTTYSCTSNNQAWTATFSAS